VRFHRGWHRPDYQDQSVAAAGGTYLCSLQRHLTATASSRTSNDPHYGRGLLRFMRYSVVKESSGAGRSSSDRRQNFPPVPLPADRRAEQRLGLFHTRRELRLESLDRSCACASSASRASSPPVTLVRRRAAHQRAGVSVAASRSAVARIRGPALGRPRESPVRRVRDLLFTLRPQIADSRTMSFELDAQ
jgi:hypothetical protein